MSICISITTILLPIENRRIMVVSYFRTEFQKALELYGTTNYVYLFSSFYAV